MRHKAAKVCTARSKFFSQHTKKYVLHTKKFVLHTKKISFALQKNSICTAKIVISTFSHTLGILLSLWHTFAYFYILLHTFSAFSTLCRFKQIRRTTLLLSWNRSKTGLVNTCNRKFKIDIFLCKLTNWVYNLFQSEEV